MDPLRAARFAAKRARPRGFEQVYVDEGDGPALLLVHGWPETRRIWWRNVEPLAKAGFRVIAPDLRGFGDSEPGTDGFADVPTHSRDLAALVHDHLGIERVVLVGGDLGGAVIQDLSLRFPELVDRLVIFNSPLPYLREQMAGMRTRPPAEASDYFVRQGSDADTLAAELDSPEQRRRYIATFYTSRFWGHPGGFTRDEVDFMTEPFAQGDVLRATFRTYESAMKPEHRSEPPLMTENPTHALILFGPSDRVIYPEFDRMAAAVFPNHVGPFLLRDCGHFLQWEAAEILNGAIASFCGVSAG